MVNAVFKCGGGDGHLKEKGGWLHCGVRRACGTAYEEIEGEMKATGVHIVDQPNELSVNQLKHPKPLVGNDIEHWRNMKRDDLDFLADNLPADDPAIGMITEVLWDREEAGED